MKKIILVLILITFCVSDNFTDGVKSYQSGDYKKANKLWEKACDNGIIKGCYYVGFSYINNKNLKKDHKKGIKYLKKACDGKIAESCAALGNLYHDGKNIKKDNKLSIKYYKKACENGLKQVCDIDIQKLDSEQIINQLNMLISDVKGYYVVKNALPDDFKKMTNIDIDGSGLNANILFHNKKCIQIIANKHNKNSAASLIIQKGLDKQESICNKLYNNKKISELFKKIDL